MMTQREAVFTVVSSLVSISPGVPVKLTDEEKRLAIELITADFQSGLVELKGDRDNEWIRKYVPGLLNNWMRKDTRLNGGGKYEAKRPGSRTGSGDEMLQQMKALWNITKDEGQRRLIEGEMAKRKAELEAAKMPTIDLEKLPASLRDIAARIAPVVRKATE